ncbi:MAG: hypothetical protein ABGW77_00040 [Campylobacterales bacterium]
MIRKLLAIGVVGVALLSGESGVDRKLDLILQKLNRLEQQIQQKDRQIEELKRELEETRTQQKTQQKLLQKEVKKEVALRSCKSLKVEGFQYSYNGGPIPSYDIRYRLVNKYPKKVVAVKGKLYVEDRDRITLLTDYLDRRQEIPPNRSVEIEKEHTINSELEKELNGEDPKKLHVYFDPIKIEFQGGESLECY